MSTYRISFEYDTIIINYDILDAWVPELKRWGAKVLIADEAHYLKNGKAKRTKAFQKLKTRDVGMIALTGTPVVNAPIEFYRTLRMIEPDLFPNFWNFAQRYCNAKHNGFGWDFRGSKNEEELFEILTKETRLMLRRLKSDVMKELDPVTRSIIRIPKTNPECDIESVDLAEMERARQTCIEVKMPHAREWIDNFLESGKKLVIFVHHRITTQTLLSWFPNSLVIDGSTPGNRRQEIVREYQSNPKRQLLIGNIKAAGVGLTLTAASDCLFLELPWTPADLRQAIDRLHRIGQENPVTAWFMLVQDSVETKIMDVLDGKAKVLSKVLNGKELDEEELLNNMKETESENN